MGTRKAIGVAVLITSVIMKAASPLISAGSPPSGGSATYIDADPAIAGRMDSARSRSAEMVDAAITVLEQGWEGMRPDERSLFQDYFDPGNTGEVDEAFVREVAGHYSQIRSDMDRGVRIVFKAEARECEGMRLYFTDFLKIFACPYLYEETNPERLARDLVHEMAHISLLALDRAYYSATDSRYQSLTPHGHWTAELPVIGKILREIARADTLYHPDAYSRYAAAVAGL